MTTKHTPGPWAAESAMSRDVSHIRYITADGKIIASVRHRVEHTQDEALANAALFAAAPDLLAALQALHAYVRGQDAAYRNGLNDTDRLYTQVHAALGRAEGL